MENENLKEEGLKNKNINSNTTNTLIDGITINPIEVVQTMYGPAPISLGEIVAKHVNPLFIIMLCALGFFAFISKKLSKKLKVIIITIIALLFVTYLALYIYYFYIVPFD